MAPSERMNPSHSHLEPPDEGSSLPVLPASLSACPLSSSTTGLRRPRMPEPTPPRLSSAEDRFRSGLSAGLLGKSAEVAPGESGILEELSRGSPSAGGTKSPKAALAGPKAAATESCKQHLGYPSSTGFSTAWPFWAGVSRFLQTTALWRCWSRSLINLPMISEFFELRDRVQARRDGVAGSLLESFAQTLSETGYARNTARRYLRAAEHFLYWMRRHGMPFCKLNERSLARFDRHLSRCHCPHYPHVDQMRVVHGAHRFLTYLRDSRIITLPSVDSSVHDPALLSAFCQWMHRQRDTRDVTLYRCSVYIRELLSRRPAWGFLPASPVAVHRSRSASVPGWLASAA